MVKKRELLFIEGYMKFRCLCCKRVFIYSRNNRLSYIEWVNSLEDHVIGCVDAKIKRVRENMKWTDINKELSK